MVRLLHLCRELRAVVPLVIMLCPIQASFAQDDYQPTTLITGSNRGLGLEFARQYAGLGWKVIATTRRPEEATELQAIRGQHPNLVVDRLDVMDEAQIGALVMKYGDQPIDLLINNAGVGGRPAHLGTAFEVEDFRFILEVNTFAPLRISQAFLDSILLSRQKKIAVITSRLGSIELAPNTSVDGPFSGSLYYSISKAGVNMGMRRLAAQLKGRGVSVAILHPGPVATDMLASTTFDLSQALTPEQSIAGMIGYLNALDLERSGRYFGHDGAEVPW